MRGLQTALLIYASGGSSVPEQEIRYFPMTCVPVCIIRKLTPTFPSICQDTDTQVNLCCCDDKQPNFHLPTAIILQLTMSREVSRYITAESFQFADKNYNIIIIIKLRKNDNKKERAWASSRAFNTRAFHWLIYAGSAMLLLVPIKGRSRCHSMGVINQWLHTMLSPMTTPLTSRRNQFRISATVAACLKKIALPNRGESCIVLRLWMVVTGR